MTGPLPQLNEQNGRGGARAAGTGPLVPGAPFRTRPYEEALRLIDQMSLSRAHRRLLLLVDGTRSFVELVRLMGRSQEEVLQLFQDLERAGLIRF